MADEIERIEAWYREHCDGEWEEQYGVQIETLDNPGWSVHIDLARTPLLSRSFSDVEVKDDDAWMVCSVRSGRFEGAGGPGMLRAILTTFLDWAEASN